MRFFGAPEPEGEEGRGGGGVARAPTPFVTSRALKL